MKPPDKYLTARGQNFLPSVAEELHWLGPQLFIKVHFLKNTKTAWCLMFIYFPAWCYKILNSVGTIWAQMTY